MQSVLIVLSICVAMAYGQDAACLATGLAATDFLPCISELAVSSVCIACTACLGVALFWLPTSLVPMAGRVFSILTLGRKQGLVSIAWVLVHMRN